MAAYFAALDPMTLVRALPGNVAQGIIWGIMALGVYITFRILDFADLTVDGSLATGGAVAVMLIRAGVNPALALVFAFLAGMAAGFVTGVLHTFFGIPGILASILTQIGLYSVNLGIMGKSNQAVNVMQYKLVASLRYVTGEGNWIFYGTWCDRYRTCSSHHQRSDFRKILCTQKSSFCLHTRCSLHRSNPLLPCNRISTLAEDAI